jgi:hypothetical protein
MKPMIKPSDLEREAQRLIKAGKMPTLARVREAIEEVRQRPRGIALRDFSFDDDADTMLLRNRKGGTQ